MILMMHNKGQIEAQSANQGELRNRKAYFTVQLEKTAKRLHENHARADRKQVQLISFIHRIRANTFLGNNLFD